MPPRLIRDRFPARPRTLRTAALWLALLAAGPVLALGPGDMPRAPLPPAGDLLRAPGLQLRWMPLEPQRADAGPARVDAALDSPLGRWRSALHMDPVDPGRSHRLETTLDMTARGGRAPLVLGDTSSAGADAALWQAPVRFGGLRLGPPPTLSRPSGWTLEAGRLRGEDEQGAPAYGEAYTAAGWQGSLAAGLVLRARAEATPQHSLGGLELQAPAIVSGATVRSALTRTDQGGARWVVGAQRRERAGLGWSLQAEGSEHGWAPLQGDPAPRSAVRASAQLPLSGRTRLELGLQSARRAEQPREAAVRLAARTRLPGRGSLRWELAQTEGAQHGWRTQVGLMLPLGG